MKTILSAIFALMALGTLAVAQPLPPYQPAPVYPAPSYQTPRPAPVNEVTPQVLGDMLHSAATFNELVRNMNLNRSLGPDVHAFGADGRLRHSVQRTAETIGAGAGAGAAIGAMSRNPNGVMIGALIGGAGGLIVDQILRHREEVREHALVYGPGPDGRPYDRDDDHHRREFREREAERK